MTEAKLRKFEDKKNYALFEINQLFNCNFSAKPKKSCNVIPSLPIDFERAVMIKASASHIL